jgi:hypothetical protein
MAKPEGIAIHAGPWPESELFSFYQVEKGTFLGLSKISVSIDLPLW